VDTLVAIFIRKHDSDIAFDFADWIPDALSRHPLTNHNEFGNAPYFCGHGALIEHCWT
jgi:hypothetical protein